MSLPSEVTVSLAQFKKLERDRDALLVAAKAAVADAEKAVNPSARLFGYEVLRQAISEAENGRT